MIHAGRYWLLLLGLVLSCCDLDAQTVTVRGHVTLETSRGRASGKSSAVIWLNPLNPQSHLRNVGDPPAPEHFRLTQRDKKFIPHVLVVPAGAVVDFPNDDPFFHNVFSLFDGKRFDLGLYEAGTTRAVNFNAPGVSYIFCNIHPEMSAVVIVTEGPYYAVSTASGDFAIKNVPAGRYLLNVWHERCLPEILKKLSREVDVSPQASSIGEIRLTQSGDLLAKHKNLYGRDYETPPSTGSYDQP
jgi:plastocyanin